MRNFQKRQGPILITAMMCYAAALAFAVFILFSAGRLSEMMHWKYVLLKGENAAIQGEALAKAWFCSSVAEEGLLDPGEFDAESPPKDDPYVSMPEDLLSVLEREIGGVSVDVAIIDENFSDSFAAEAASLNLPRALPIPFLVCSGDEEEDCSTVKKYIIKASAAYGPLDENRYVIAEEILVLRDTEGKLRVFPSYIKKR